MRSWLDDNSRSCQANYTLKRVGGGSCGQMQPLPFGCQKHDSGIRTKSCFVITVPVGESWGPLGVLGRASGRRRRRQPTLSRPLVGDRG